MVRRDPATVATLIIGQVAAPGFHKVLFGLDPSWQPYRQSPAPQGKAQPSLGWTSEPQPRRTAFSRFLEHIPASPTL